MSSPESIPPASQAPTGSPWTRTQCAIFTGALLGPPVLTMLAAMMAPRGGAAPALMLLGGGAGGLVAGVMLGCRFGKSDTTKVLASIVLAGIGAVAVIGLSGLGCSLGNYRPDFR